MTQELQPMQQGVSLSWDDGQITVIGPDAKTRQLTLGAVSVDWVEPEMAVAPPTPVAPTITRDPVAGPALVGGQPALATTALASGTPSPSISYQWQLQGVNIAATYVFQSADIGDDVTVIATASNGQSPDATATSAAVQVTAPVQYNAFAPWLGQSRFIATHNIDNSTVYGDGFTDDEVFFLNPAWMNDPANDQLLPLRIVKSGATVDGFEGKLTEYDSPNGAGPISGMGYQKNNGDGSFIPNANLLYMLKSAQSGQNQAAMAPGGGQFDTADAMDYRIADILAQSGTPLRVLPLNYGQGSAEASTVHNALVGTYGTDPANLIPPALLDTRIANWGDLLHEKTIPAWRDGYGIDDLPFFFYGLVLPDRDDPTAPFNDYEQANQPNMARIREGVEAEQRSLCRYYVEVSGTSFADVSYTLVDRGSNAPRLIPTYDAPTDKVNFANGAADPRCDDFGVYVSLRGLLTNDGLHDESDVGFLASWVMIQVMSDLGWLDANGDIPATRTVARIRPRFYDEPYVSGSVGDTSVTVGYQASFLQGGEVDSFMGVYAAGSTPTGPEIAAGSGSGFISAHNELDIRRRQTETEAITGLSTGTPYRIAQVLRDADGTYSRVKYLDITTTGAGDTTPPTITSAANISVAEEQALSHALTADESVTWDIVGGVDAAQFNISGSTLRWVGDGDQDFELPADNGGDNVYDVTVRATDAAGNQTTLAMTVTVTDVAEGGSTPTVQNTDSDSAAAGGSITVNFTAQAGERALLFVANADQPVATPTGWSIFGSTSTENGGNVGAESVAQGVVFQKEITTTGADSVAIDDTGAFQIGGVMILANAGAMTFLADNTDGTLTGGDADLRTAMSAPDLPAVAAGSLVLAVAIDSLDSATTNMTGATNNNLANLTTRFDLPTNASNGGGLHVVSGTLAAGGNTGTTDFTFAQQTGVAVMTIAIAPA